MQTDFYLNNNACCKKSNINTLQIITIKGLCKLLCIVSKQIITEITLRAECDIFIWIIS